MVKEIAPLFEIENCRTRHYPGCTLFLDSVPLEAFRTIEKTYPNGVVCPGLAHVANAVMAVGRHHDACEAVKAHYLPSFRKRIRHHYAGSGLSRKALDWLSEGEFKVSVLALFHHLTETRNLEGELPDTYPADPDGFRRCCLLLERVPELQEKVFKMSNVSPEWAELVERWGSLYSTMKNEFPDWRDAVRGESQLRDLLELLIERASDRRQCA